LLINFVLQFIGCEYFYEKKITDSWRTVLKYSSLLGR